MSFEKAMNKHKEKTKERYGIAGLEGGQPSEPKKLNADEFEKKSVFETVYIDINGVRYPIQAFAEAVGYMPMPVTNDYLDAFKGWAWHKARNNKKSVGSMSLPPDSDLVLRPLMGYHDLTNKNSCCPPDMVNHPSHYTAGGIETLDFVREKLNANTAIDHWQAYCFGNALKYITRAGLKGDMKEDIKKAIFYLRSAIGDDPR